MNEELIMKIPADGQNSRSWKVKLDGEIIEKVGLLEIENPKFGKITYGLSKAGYDTWAYRDVGGAVTIPFSFVNDRLFIGVVKQLRHNQGGHVWNVPRGFIDFGETLESTARRELYEESGYSPDENRIINLKGEGGNCNSAFFDTSDSSNTVAYFGVEIESSELEASEHGFKISLAHSNDNEESLNLRAMEMIGEMRFISWIEAARLGDMFSNTAVSRLLAHLAEKGIVSIDLKI